jgi:hypothetical protein
MLGQSGYKADSTLRDTTPRVFTPFIMAGLFGQPKLIPLKWMAAQLALEFEMAPAALAFQTGGTSTDFFFELSSVNFITEMLEFDSTFDAGVALGLDKDGIPIKFNSWDTFITGVSSNVISHQVPSRARSIKYILSVIKDISPSCQNLYVDSGRWWHAIGETYEFAGSSTLEQRTPFLTNLSMMPLSDYQWRIGGRYYPAQPVNCDAGGAEALVELQKVTDYLGDYQKSLNITQSSWSSSTLGGGQDFIMAICCENTDAFPGSISGINGEEQSDISLIAKCNANNHYNDALAGGKQISKQIYSFVSFDSLIVVRGGNDVVLTK